MTNRITLILLLAVTLTLYLAVRSLTSEINSLKARVHTLEEQVNSAPVLESTLDGWARFRDDVSVEVVPYDPYAKE